MNSENYVQLLMAFKDKGYNFSEFNHNAKQGHVVMRHDVDFSLPAALAMARLEAEYDVKSTYFFMLTSNFYNLISEVSLDLVRKIAAAGHTISLHFDPSVYENIDTGFAYEKALFEDTFDVPVEIISLHRPRGFLDDNNRTLRGARHTYEDVVFKDMKYVSDSGGTFKHGAPTEADAFATGANMHVLIHPIWWMFQGTTSSKTLRAWQTDHFDFLNDEILANCTTFDGKRCL